MESGGVVFYISFLSNTITVHLSVYRRSNMEFEEILKFIFFQEIEKKM